ncbi:MAG: chromate transporter [Clostridiales bacterium]|nr:chromate transporter [Clostridiales bacterium]
MIYLTLLWAFVQIGLFSFGGGYAAMPLIQGQVVDTYHWLSQSEFVDVVSISQMTPGPIAVNAATFVGQRVAGLPGALVATLGCVLPPCVLTLTVARFYYKHQSMTLVQGALDGLRPVVIALIASAGVSILSLVLWPAGFTLSFSSLDWPALLLAGACLFILRKWKAGPILVMLGAGLLGLVLYGLGLLPGI